VCKYWSTAPLSSKVIKRGMPSHLNNAQLKAGRSEIRFPCLIQETYLGCVLQCNIHRQIIYLLFIKHKNPTLMPASPGYFVKMIKRLRAYEEILLYDNILNVEAVEQNEVAEFLAVEYLGESHSYPYVAPPFSSDAAVWAAKTVYIAAQLMLYRENKETELDALLPAYTGTLSPPAILSADLCLRFLPDMVHQLKVIDSQDKLIEVLTNILQQWHYSGIKQLESAESLDFTNITANDCMLQLYADRVIAYKNRKLSMHPSIHKKISAALGDFGDIYWSEFKLETTIDE
jgi:hypothetical protein